MTKAKVDEAASASENPPISFERYVEEFLPLMHTYTKAYLSAMYRGQMKSSGDWVKEPEIAKLLKKE
jgi:hypothetical protein